MSFSFDALINPRSSSDFHIKECLSQKRGSSLMLPQSIFILLLVNCDKDLKSMFTPLETVFPLVHRVKVKDLQLSVICVFLCMPNHDSSKW